MQSRRPVQAGRHQYQWDAAADDSTENKHTFVHKASARCCASESLGIVIDVFQSVIRGDAEYLV